MLQVLIPNFTSMGKCMSSDFNKCRQILVSYFVLLHNHFNDDYERRNYFPVRYGTFFVELIVFQSKNNLPKNINQLCNYKHFHTGKLLEGIYQLF